MRNKKSKAILKFAAFLACSFHEFIITLEVSISFANSKDTIPFCDSSFISPGIGENINSKNIYIKIYPNPSRNIFNIKTSKPGLLKFYNINGKIVDTIESSGKKHIKWEPKDLPEGTYFVRLISQENRTIAVEKLIYNK